MDDDTPANEPTLAAGMPMTREEIRLHLQSHYNKPVALRKEGGTTVKCPYTGAIVDTPPGPGYFRPDPMDADMHDPTTPDQGLVINDRYFGQNYGFLIIEYHETDTTIHIIE